MNEYTITNNAIEILTGSTNTTSPIYTEAVANIDKGENKSIGYLKRFLSSINKMTSSGKLDNSMISSTKGNISSFAKYDDINKAIEYLSKYVPSSVDLKNIKLIKADLEKNKALYMEGYNKKIDIIIIEYDSALYAIVQGIAFIITNYIDVKNVNGKVSISSKANTKNKGIISKTFADLAKEMTESKHAEYIKGLLEAAGGKKVNADTTSADTKTEDKSDKPEVQEESTELFSEALSTAGSLKNAIDLITTLASGVANGGKAVWNIGKLVVKSAFGIFPIIRSVIYLRYKSKAKMIDNLEMQSAFIKLNIDQLKNQTNIDPEKKAEIIKKQEAVIEGFMKKAEKLRAQLVETEKDASDALAEDNNEIKNAPAGDDDFLLD